MIEGNERRSVRMKNSQAEIGDLKWISVVSFLIVLTSIYYGHILSDYLFTMTIGLGTIAVVTTVAVWVNYFSRPSWVMITSDGLLLEYRSRPSMHVAWNDLKAMSELYGNRNFNKKRRGFRVVFNNGSKATICNQIGIAIKEGYRQSAGRGIRMVDPWVVVY